jgi:hypothetical protein
MWGTRFILVRGNAGNSDNASQPSLGQTVKCLWLALVRLWRLPAQAHG